MNRKKQIFTIATVAVMTCSMLTGCDLETVTDLLEQSSNGKSGECSVYFLDVDQGDSELIVTDSAAVLIDAGEASEADTILSALQEYGVTKLDWIIATHPHADHIGGFADILEYAAEYDDLTIENVMMPEVAEEDIPTTRTYEKFLDGIDANGLEITYATATTLDLGSASMQIIPAPEGNTGNLNNYSILSYLEDGAVSVLFTGDASEEEEKDLIEDGSLNNIHPDVLKVGHHGSAESSTEEFLEQIQPKYAVISCGVDNSYGHPTEAALKRLKEYCGDNIYRTDTDGTICLTIDGEEITIKKAGKTT